MIKNGNYIHFDLDKYRDKLIEVFTEYFGQEYADTIAKKINKVFYQPFHTLEFVKSYYSKYIYKYRDEILNKTFKKLGFARNETRDDILFPAPLQGYTLNEDIYLDPEYDDNDYESEFNNKEDIPPVHSKVKIPSIKELLDEEPEDSVVESTISTEYSNMSNLLFALKGGVDFSKGNLSFKEVMDISQMRSRIADAFGIQGGNNEIYLGLQTIKKALDEVVHKIHDKYKSDVFHDIERFEYNFINTIRKYFDIIKSEGFLLSEHDEDIIYNSESLTMEDIQGLDCIDILISRDLVSKPLISYFDFDNENILNTKGNYYDKGVILLNRLRYLAKYDVCFEYISEEDLYSDTISYDILKKEYDYQKANLSPENLLGYSLGARECLREKYYREGYFIPCENIEFAIIDDIVSRLYNNCECSSRLDLNNTDMTLDEIILNKCSSHYPQYLSDSEYTSTVFMCEDQSYCSKNFLNILIHELCHAISQDNRIIKGKDRYNKTSLSIIKESKFYDNYTQTYYDEGLTSIEENINERIAVEITELFKKKFGDIHIEYDDVGMGNGVMCEYSVYDFLLDKLYNKFYKEIKKNAIDRDNMYYNINLEDKLINRIFTGIKNILGIPTEINNPVSIFQFLFSKIKGIPDEKERLINFEYMKQLSAIIEYFYDNIMNEMAFPSDFNSLTEEEILQYIPQDVLKKLQLLSRKANEITRKIELTCTEKQI